MAAFGHKATPTPKKTITVTPTRRRRHIKLQNILLADITQVTLNCFPLATGWTVRGSNPRWEQVILYSMPVQTWPGAHPVTCPGASSRGGDLTTHAHLAP